jgi:hypothetical protein
VALIASELIQAMQTAFSNEWQATKGSPLPAGGTEDRRLLFAAVAKGLLGYLDDRHDGVLTEITFQDAGLDPQAHRVVGAKFDIQRS